METSTYQSIITLNNRLLHSKTHMVAARTKNKRPFHMLPTRDSFQSQIHRLKERGWRKMSHGDKKKVGIATQISARAEFETFIKRQGHYLVTKGSIQEENITLINTMHPVQQDVNIKSKHSQT